VCDWTSEFMANTHSICTVLIIQPHNESTSFGPLISEAQRDKVIAYIESGKEQGARVVTGGQKWPQSNGGYWVEPTILADTNPDMKVVQEEVSFNLPRIQSHD